MKDQENTRNFSMTKIGCSLLLFTLLLNSWVFAAYSQEANLKINDLKIQIEKAKKEIASEEKIWAEEKSREVEGEKRRRERYDSFNEEKIEVSNGIKELEVQIQERMDQIERLKMKSENLERQIKFFGKVDKSRTGLLRSICWPKSSFISPRFRHRKNRSVP